MHAQHSNKKWLKDRLAPAKDLFRKRGSRTPSPSPQGALAEPSTTVNTDVPTASSREPSRMPIISPQASASAMVTPMEEAASFPHIHEGTNITSLTGNQTEIIQESSKASKVMSAAGASSTEPGNLSESKAKDGLKTAWHGLKMILGQVEELLDGTPFKVPVAAINMLIRLGDAISNNHDTLKELMIRIERQIEIVESSLSDDDTTDMVLTKMKKDFARIILLQDLSDLQKLENNRLWRNILENEQVKAEVQRILRNFGGNTEDFYQLQLNNWPRSHNAIYNAYIKNETTLSRGPCTPNTRVSVLEQIYKWAQDTTKESPHVFWLTGQAGSGKSTIAYTVADHFDNKFKDMSCILQATFFCSRQFDDTKHQWHIIPTIVYQLAKNSRSFAHSLLDANKFDSVDILSKQMKDLLADPWQKSMSSHTANFPSYLIVIDALDEIEGREGSAFLKELLTVIKD
ncbi:hypothetical protein C0992_004321, partial [Termitomyces sp. T32_za158]